MFFNLGVVRNPYQSSFWKIMKIFHLKFFSKKKVYIFMFFFMTSAQIRSFKFILKKLALQDLMVLIKNPLWLAVFKFFSNEFSNIFYQDVHIAILYLHCHTFFFNFYKVATLVNKSAVFHHLSYKLFLFKISICWQSSKYFNPSFNYFWPKLFCAGVQSCHWCWC